MYTFDLECIDSGSGSYVRIATNLCRVAGTPGAFTDLRDHVDIENGTAWIAYTRAGKPTRWDIDVEDDWADVLVLAYLMDDLRQLTGAGVRRS